jgi:hypothetical protein
METRSIFILLALLVAAGAFAEAYTWTDDDGIVHYSDRPHPGATIVELGEYSATRTSPTTRRPATSSSASDDESNESPATGYTSLEITSPGAEETLWNIAETLTVTLALTPALQPGHQVRAYLDMQPQVVNGTSFQIQEVYRGVHNLQVEVIDETGKLVIRSRPSRFYVQQNSIL